MAKSRNTKKKQQGQTYTFDRFICKEARGQVLHYYISFLPFCSLKATAYLVCGKTRVTSQLLIIRVQGGTSPKI
jgi:hypothetical protein